VAVLKRSKKPVKTSRRPTRVGKNSTSVEKMQLGLKQRLLAPAVLAVCGVFLGALIVIFLIVLWFSKIYADPEHVFSAMLNNNLATQSITKATLRTSGSSSSQDFVQIAFSPELRVHDLKAITDNTTKPASKLTLETIGTVSADYQRYSHIERPNSTKTQQDYQKVYDAWLKNGGQQGGSGQAMGNSLFSAVLYGDFNSVTRAQLLTELKASYSINYAKVSKKGSINRRTYIYHATVPLQKYAKAAHDYAQALGLPLASQINPASYQPTDKLDINITVDVLSRQIKKVDYLSQNFSENYSGQGNAATIILPQKTVSTAVFQDAVKSLNP